MTDERTVAPEALFCSFNLERHMPADHLLRSIDRFVDLSDSGVTLATQLLAWVSRG